MSWGGYSGSQGPLFYSTLPNGCMINLMMWSGNIKSTAMASALLFVLLGVSAQAQLPDSFSGWETTNFRPVSPDRLAEFVGGDAALLREYGVVTGEHREYSRADAKLAVTLWKMKDTSGSFGLFTFYREIGTASLEAGNRVALWPRRLLIQHGPYLLDAEGASLTMGEGKLLLGKISPLRKDENLLPSLPAFLPEENLIPQSAKFLMGPVAFGRLEKNLPISAMGFDSGAEAEMAQYRVDGNQVRLLLVSYATPQLAAKKLRSFQQLPAVSQAKPGSEIFLQRRGPLVCFVLDSPAASTAETLLKNIRYQSEVTWNEYTPTRRDNIAHLVLSGFLLAGFILLFSLVAGLSFGGIRILSKKYLPIPIFDRPAQMEIIRLNLSDR